DEFVSIDARGYVAQCDCWVTSYPDYWFGNIFAESSFTDLLEKSPARRNFQIRPEKLMIEDSCADCDYLSVCHGGCPVRTYSITGSFFGKILTARSTRSSSRRWRNSRQALRLRERAACCRLWTPLTRELQGKTLAIPVVHESAGAASPASLEPALERIHMSYDQTLLARVSTRHC